jgi:hypothetical protein
LIERAQSDHLLRAVKKCKRFECWFDVLLEYAAAHKRSNPAYATDRLHWFLSVVAVSAELSFQFSSFLEQMPNPKLGSAVLFSRFGCGRRGLALVGRVHRELLQEAIFLPQFLLTSFSPISIGSCPE